MKVVSSRPNSGQKRLTTAREDRIIERIAIRDNTKTSRDLPSESVSASTVRRHLVASGLQGGIASRKPRLTAIHKIQSLEWVKKYKNWTIEDWGNVLWLNESNIEV
ncbi:hypothetical protein Trydic_g523 [Trypoxylus dichotomus]